ncbi:hypothetical protein ABK040_004387 [Willaertia magna]
MTLSGTASSETLTRQDDDGETTEEKKQQLKKNVMLSDKGTKKLKNHIDMAGTKQRYAFEKLRKDNDLLRETIANLTRNINMNESVSIGNKINKLSDTVYGLTIKIEKEKEKVKILQDHYSDVTNRIEEARVERSGVKVSEENNKMIEKQIKVLENRLDKALVKFNEALTQNKGLRDQIENLRRERVVFDSIYKKMEKELQEKKKEMAKIIELSNSAHEERGQAVEELKSIKSKHQDEMLKIEIEREQLDGLLKEAERVTEKLQQREKERRERELQEATDTDRKKLTKTNWNLAGQKAKQYDMTEKRKQYEDKFEKIELATGKNIDVLIEEFSQSEDQNFSLFTYVNELNSEVEKLEEQIAELEEEIKKFKGEGINSESQRKKVLADIQDKINETNMKTELYQKKYENSLKTIDVIAKGIEKIFTTLECDATSVSEMLGTSGVTESNMMIYLGLIEQKTNELIQTYFGTKGDLATLEEIGPKNPVGISNTLSIEPPSTSTEGNSDEEDDEEEDRPFTREELIQRARKIGGKKPKQKRR